MILFQRLDSHNCPVIEFYLDWRTILVGFTIPRSVQEWQFYALHFGPLHLVWTKQWPTPKTVNR